ncbi:MAG: hypothetical protein ACJARD_000816 [Alphaproteobacteria bacterium]|jgi:hypothetical protein
MSKSTWGSLGNTKSVRFAYGTAYGTLWSSASSLIVNAPKVFNGTPIKDATQEIVASTLIGAMAGGFAQIGVDAVGKIISDRLDSCPKPIEEPSIIGTPI